MGIPAIPSGMSPLTAAPPAVASRQPAPVLDPVTTSGPLEGNGDPDDTGYASEPIAPGHLDLTA